jgi:hypothetical protein
VNYDRILWWGIMGNIPYPDRPSGRNLSQNGGRLFAQYRRDLKKLQKKTWAGRNDPVDQMVVPQAAARDDD